MNLPKLPYTSSALADFFEEGLQSLGAICERSWHDRLQVLAEGRAARVWNSSGDLVETEIYFPPAGDAQPRDAAREVFPGCPLTFHLSELLFGREVALERAALKFTDAKAPSPEVALKTWQAQFAGTTHWEQLTPFLATHHFSLLALVRCEIQATDQHWSLHRIAFGVPEGGPDPALASSFEFAELAAPAEKIEWPGTDASTWMGELRRALQLELAPALLPIEQRQKNYLRREIERIDAYFAGYERELTARAKNVRDKGIKLQERLAATRAEHQRRRQDQVQRHEIRVLPHLDAILLVAEPALKCSVRTVLQREAATVEALYIPRSRTWIKSAPAAPTP